MNRRARVRGIGRSGAPRGVARIAVLGFIAALLGPLAFGEAEAASFYTRKRVNGVWITGQFPKGGAGSASRRFRRVARAPVVVDDEPETAPLPPVPSVEGLVRDAGRSDGPETTAAIPRTVASLAEPFPDPAIPDERLARLKEALTAHATILVARPSEPEPAKSAALPALVGAAEAAPARPPVLAASPAAPAPGIAAPSPAPSGLAPRSVSYDFETGIKTTVFENSVVREPFDVAAMKALTPRPAAR